MATFFNEMPPEIAATYEELDRKRRITDALMKRNLSKDRSTQFTPGRYSFAVKQNPLAGLTELAEAYILNRKQKGIDAQLAKLGKDYEQGYQDEYRDVMDTYRGREEAPAVMPQATGDPAYNAALQAGTGPMVPGFKPDPMGATMQAIGSGDPRMQRVGEAMMDMERYGSGRGQYRKNIEMMVRGPDGQPRIVQGQFDARAVDPSKAYLDSNGNPIRGEIISVKDPMSEMYREMGKGYGGEVGGAYGRAGYGSPIGGFPQGAGQPQPMGRPGMQQAPQPTGAMPVSGVAPTVVPSEAQLAAQKESAIDTAAMQNPDSPEYREARGKHAGDYEKYRTLINTKNKVLEDIQYILAPENRAAFEANFGGYNAYATRLQPGDAVQDMRARIESLKASMKAAGKQLATADGTTIGQITEREWPILEQQIANITPMLGEPGAEEVFNNVSNLLGGMQDTATEVYNKRWSTSPFYDKYVDLSQPPPGVNPTIWNNMSEQRKKEFLKAGEQ